MNLNDLEKVGEIPARGYADYLLLTPKEISYYTGWTVDSIRSYLTGKRPTPACLLIFLKSMAYAKATMSDREYVTFKGFLSGRITVPLHRVEEPEIHDRKS